MNDSIRSKKGAPGGVGQRSSAMMSTTSIRGAKGRVTGLGGAKGRNAKGSRSSVAQSRATTKIGGDRDRIVVLDEQGNDVTPKPMMSLRPTVLKGTQMSMQSGFSDEGERQSQPMFDRMSSTNFSQSNFSESGETSPKSDGGETDAVDAETEADAKSVKGRSAIDLAQMFDKPDPLAIEDLDKDVFVTLQETETFWMFDLASLTVSAESAEAEAVEAKNQKYKDLLKEHESSDRFAESEMQTLNLMQKQKEVQSDPMVTHSKEAQVNEWSIYDTFAETEQAGEDGDDAVIPGGAIDSAQLAAMSGHAAGSDAGASRGARGSQATIGSSQMYPDTATATDMQSIITGGVGGSVQYGADFAQQLAQAAEEADVDTLASVNKKELMSTLQLVDSVLAQNSYLDKLLMYRNVKPLEIQESAKTRKLEMEAAAEAAEAARREAEALEEENSKKNAAAASSDEEDDEDARVLDSETGAQLEGTGPAEDEKLGADAEEEEDPEAEEEDDDEQADPDAMRMQLLWEFKCDITAGRNVACLGWNKVRKDLLAVAYGQFEFGKQKDGLVAFWSLKNPDYPLWHFHTHCGVTALDFSAKHGNILAVGLYDGTVAIYDVMARQQTAAMEANHSSGKHSDPVWKMRWVEQVTDMDKLVTISTDGRVSLWSITKGLEFNDLMKLKRVVPKQVPNASQGGAAAANMNTEAFISRRSSGMSFDFSTRDPRIYIAGTEDGPIHKCSTSYSEQYLETYMGHKGPVYNVQWSHYRPGLFLSCSADWTVRLWTEEKENELLIFQSASEQVNDVQWCPTNSTVFGTVTNGGYVEIWDISISTMKPVTKKRPAGRCKQNCLLFSDISPVVVCGGAGGVVAVYRLFNCTMENEGPDEQRERLDSAITANIVKTEPGSTEN